MGVGSGRLRVLAFAFACDPELGSEAAGGWGTVNALAEFADVTVLVNSVHMPNIQAWQRRYPNPALAFVAVPFERRSGRAAKVAARAPQWLHQGERWIRYLRWQEAAKDVALRLNAEQPFAAAIHASLGIHWLPSPVVDLPLPSVWGPVSGGAHSPPLLWRHLGPVGVVVEGLESFIGAAAGLAPATRRTRRTADVRLVESTSTRQQLPRDLRADTRVVNRAILSKIRDVPTVERQPYLVFSSPLQKRKGPTLALAALAHTPPHVRLLVIHRGPEEGRLRRLAERLGVADRVEFRGRVPRDEMWATIAGAAACVFTGLREEGGCALAEAMLAGAPVVVLGHGGARLLAEANTDPSRVAIVTPGGPDQTARDLGAAMTTFAAAPSTRRAAYLDQGPTKAALHDAIVTAVDRRAAAPSTTAPTPAI